tara:strand:+ start:185 stop:442 length:258 start_codon:yes stop_codon:yes gene_type:complete
MKVMTEQTLKDLGFRMQHETTESSGLDYDWYYYTLDIGDISLITNANDEAGEDNWEVSIFDFPSCVIKRRIDLEDLIEIIQINTK